MISARLNYDTVPALAKETNDKLKQHWDDVDLLAYARDFNHMMQEVRLQTLTDKKDSALSFKLVSATNRAFLGDRSLTQPAEQDKILARARLSHQLLSDLPIQFRQGMLNYFMQNSFPKVAPAAAVAQTANMGKSISESRAEINGKGKAWFDWAASETVRHYVENYNEPGVGIKSGLYFANENGVELKTSEQFAKAKNVLVTQYPENKKTTGKGGVVKGSGISVEQPPTNYTALAFPGLTLPLLVGNASITKIPTRVPDPFVIIMQAFLQDARDYMEKFGPELSADVREKVNLSKPETVDAIIAGLAQAVSNRGWEKHGNTFRIVGGMKAGQDVYKNRMESLFISDPDTLNSTYELAGDNPMYLDILSPERLSEIAKYLLQRVASNSGMICTRINAALVKIGVFESFKQKTLKEFREYNAQALANIGNPHDEKIKQGALISEHEYNTVAKHIAYLRENGVEFEGCERLYTEKGGVFLTPGVAVWNESNRHLYEKIRGSNEEIFAPMTNLVPVQDVDDAAWVTNLSTNSLSSAIMSDDTEVINRFIDQTNLGSYNVNNPKLGSDNSPFGEHIGKYPGIEVNGPTGGLAQYRQHLGIPHQMPEHAVWMDPKAAVKVYGSHFALAI